MSMFWADGVTSIGSTLVFFGGRLWGRGRLTAPPTASVEPHRHTHVNTTAANMKRHTPAILALTILRSKNQFSSPVGLLKLPWSYFLNSSLLFVLEFLSLSVSNCSLLFPICLVNLKHTDTEEMQE